jgi:hypothetical protein
MCVYVAAETRLPIRFIAPHEHTEINVTYRYFTVSVQVAAETCLPIRFIVPTRTVPLSTFPTNLLYIAYTLPRKRLLFTCPFYCPHTTRTEVTVSYRSPTVSVHIRCRGNVFTYPFYFPHTDRWEVTISYRVSTVSVYGRCNCDPVKPHVTGSNDAILIEVGRTTAVFGEGASRPGFALGHSFGTLPRGPAGQHQFPGLVWYDQVGLMPKFP